VVAEVQVAVPVRKPVGAERGARDERVEDHELDRVDEVEDDVGGALQLRVRGVRHDDEPVLIAAALGPLGHRHLERVAERRLGGTSRAEGMNQGARVAEQRDVSEHLHPVL
jgi:hypothetical protein